MLPRPMKAILDIFPPEPRAPPRLSRSAPRANVIRASFSRFDPEKESVLVILPLDQRAANFQARVVKTSQRCILAAVAEEHCRSKPFANPLSRRASCEACDE